MQSEQDWQTRLQSAWSSTKSTISARLSGLQSENGGIASYATPRNMLLFGAALGLIVGLLIGWVIWPVEWQGARISHLDADAQAQYVAAVADAYIAAGGTETARELALRRLAGLDIPEAIVNAQRYFIANNRAVSGVELSEAERVLVENDGYEQRLVGDANIRLSNLNQLATGLGVESFLAADLPVDQNTTGAVGAPGGDIQPIETATVPAQAGGVPAADADSGASFFSILLGGLAALLLVVGGLWVLYRLSQRRNSGEDAGATPVDGNYTNPDDDLQQVPLGAQYTTNAASQHRNAPTRSARDDRADEIGGFSFNSLDNVEPFAPDNMGEGTQEWSTSPVGHVQSEPFAPSAGSSSRARAFQTQQSERQYDDIGESSLPQDGDQRYAPTGSSSADEPLSEFTAEYSSSMAPTYEDSRNITVDTADGTEMSIGGYGLGVNIQNGVRADAPQDVIALDLWLLDKSDTRNPQSHTLVFLSEYAVDNGLVDSLHGERSDDPPPVVPEVGARYQLHGVELMLDCQVLEVEYVPDGDGQGSFAHFKVHLSVFQPAG